MATANRPDRPDIGNAVKPHTRAESSDTLCASGLRSPDSRPLRQWLCYRNDVFAVQVATNTGTSLIMPAWPRLDVTLNMLSGP